MKKPNTGFTAVELAVTMALAAIVVTMAAPSMWSMVKSSRITAATNSLVTSLQFARTQALSQKRDISVVATGADWTDGWEVQDADGNVLRSITPVGGKVTIVSEGKLDTFTFNLAGFLTSAPDVVHVCDSSQAKETGREITLSAVGRVKTDSTYICD